MPLPDRGSGPGKHRAGGLSAGGHGPFALAGVRLYPAARRQKQKQRGEGSHRLEFSALCPLLAADRVALLPECR